MAKAAKNTKENFKDMPKADLSKALLQCREETRKIRFKSEGAKSKNVKELLSLKKKIARILTELNNKSKK